MKIFKFGGASVKDANGVKNIAKILKEFGYKNTLVVVSAMGKTTNAFENVIDNYINTPAQLHYAINDIKAYHNTILVNLFKNNQHPVFNNVAKLFEELSFFFSSNKSPNYNFIYDQVIGYGELISTTIISHYLNEVAIKNTWLDVRKLIKTDTYYRNAKVDWEATQKCISNGIDHSVLHITQGFLASDANNFTTTLGREGSDYSAAIFAYCLNAESVTIWKDVPGVLNADPRVFSNTQLLNQMSYREAIELSFYGASVIHPKTLQPLQRKEIVLFVKSFLDPKQDGTKVCKGNDLAPKVPCFILKSNQVLISLSSLDFSFIVEENISEIFRLLHQFKMKVNLIQNSAISFSVCVENKYNQLDDLLQHLKAKFKVTHTQNVALFTIRHYNQDAIQTLEKNKTILLKQLYKETMQIVVK